MNSSRVEENKRGSDEYKRKTNVTASADLPVAMDLALSILHRATGIGLAIGTLLLVGWLLALSEGPDRYASYQGFIGHWFSRLLLFGWTWALFYHLCNGIRHLAFGIRAAVSSSIPPQNPAISWASHPSC